MLQKTDFVFYQILYTIWKLSVYYADLMGYKAPENPLKMNVKIIHVEECSFIRVKLSAYEIFDENKMLLFTVDL